MRTTASRNATARPRRLKRDETSAVQLFSELLHNDFASVTFGYAPYGGPSAGEVEALARAVGNGGDDAFYAAFVAAGDRLVARAEEKERRGHRASAGESLLRAAVLYGLSFKPLYGAPVAPRLKTAFATSVQAFERGLTFVTKHRRLRIPYAHTTIPAYVLPGARRSRRAASIARVHERLRHHRRRCVLRRRGRRRAPRLSCADLRWPRTRRAADRSKGSRCVPDWEVVVRRCSTWRRDLEGVDSSRIALCGWSLGGYLGAPRGVRRRAHCGLHRGPGTFRAARGLRQVGGQLRTAARHGPDHARRRDAGRDDGGARERSQAALGHPAARVLGARRGGPRRLLAPYGTVFARGAHRMRSGARR